MMVLMPAYGECRSTDIAAPPRACFAALTDYERLPEWQRAVCAARVLERDARGRGTVVEYEVDARVRRVRYRLRQIYDEPRRLGSEYLGGDFRDFSGEWRFSPRGLRVGAGAAGVVWATSAGGMGICARSRALFNVATPRA